MQFTTAAISIALALATLSQAAPTATKVARAKAPATTCLFSAMAEDGDTPGIDVSGAGGAVSPPRKARQVTAFMSSTGAAIWKQGDKDPFWTNAGFNVWDVDEQIIKSDDTGLAMDLTYKADGTTPTLGCSVSYNSVDHDCDGDSDIDFSLGTDSFQYGAATFPCTWKPGKEPTKKM